MTKPPLVCLFAGIIAFASLFSASSVQAGVGVSPSSINFGSVTVNATSTATLVVTNNSRQTVTVGSVFCNLPQVVVSGPALPMTLAPRSSTSFQVTFHPNSAGAYSGTLTVSAGRNGGQLTTVSVLGNGISSSANTQLSYLLSPSANSLTFGSQLVGSGSSQSLTLTNTGTGSVSVSQVTYTGAGFSVSDFSGAATLASGQSLSLSVSFAPSAAGSVTGSVSVVSTATNSPATIALSGTGIQPQISVIPSSVAFGNVITGVTNTQTITVKNPGSATLTVSQASLAGTGYGLSGLTTPLSIAPGGSAFFNVGFSPASAGTFSGSVTLTSNAPTSPLTVSLSGTGAAASYQLSASPTALSFGSLTTGTSTAQTVTLTNSGNSSVSVSQVTESGTGFSLSAIGLPLTLAAGQTASFSVTFAPAAAGSDTGSVTVVSNAANSPLTLALSGTGTAPVSHTVAISWTPSASTYNGFNVYRGTTSGGPYTRVDSALISTPLYSDISVTSGQTYYYVATEVDTTGAESAYSSEVSAAVP